MPVRSQKHVIFNKIRSGIQCQNVAFDRILRRHGRHSTVSNDMHLADQRGIAVVQRQCGMGRRGQINDQTVHAGCDQLMQSGCRAGRCRRLRLTPDHYRQLLQIRRILAGRSIPSQQRYSRSAGRCGTAHLQQLLRPRIPGSGEVENAAGHRVSRPGPLNQLPLLRDHENVLQPAFPQHLHQPVYSQRIMHIKSRDYPVPGCRQHLRQSGNFGPGSRFNHHQLRVQMQDCRSRKLICGQLAKVA
ncbi:hypothetical protein D3C73_706290 [compost metagenome]